MKNAAPESPVAMKLRGHLHLLGTLYTQPGTEVRLDTVHPAMAFATDEDGSQKWHLLFGSPEIDGRRIWITQVRADGSTHNLPLADQRVIIGGHVGVNALGVRESAEVTRIAGFSGLGAVKGPDALEVALPAPFDQTRPRSAELLVARIVTEFSMAGRSSGAGEVSRSAAD